MGADMRLLVFSLSIGAVTPGLLKVGTPMSWAQSMPHLSYVREHGVLQFLSTWRAVNEQRCDDLRWGDEIEYAILKLDDDNKRVDISLRGQEVQNALNQREKKMMSRPDGCTWHNEYGAWMVEGTPRAPYSGYASDLLQVESNMRRRRRRLLAALARGEVAPTMTNLPTMGAVPMEGHGGPVANSRYVADNIINPHPRFAALTQNIRARRGENVDIRLPLFIDEKTPEGTFDSSGLNGRAAGKSDPASAEVHMDAMAFGMGCTCLQVTFQCTNLEESRFLHDQLLVLGPIMLALTAASPAFRGKLVDTDTRWDVISMAVDDRTPAERGLETATDEGPRNDAEKEMAGHGRKRLIKSRYSSSSRYLYGCELPQALNDLDIPIPEDHVKTLKDSGVDEALAMHVASLFNRDPLVVFEGSVSEVDDDESTEHFDSLQSTNWNSMRWKPPPRGSDTGWRVEFRTMENQLTDFENAAFSTFLVLLSRAILTFDLLFYLPISAVDENFQRARERDAVLNQKFHWRKHLAPPEAEEVEEAPKTGEYWWKSILCSAVNTDATASKPTDPINEMEEMTLAEIMGGKGDYFPGLVPLCHAYLESVPMDAATRRRLVLYLELVQLRADGTIPTAAKWARVRWPSRANADGLPPEAAGSFVSPCRSLCRLGFGAGASAVPAGQRRERQRVLRLGQGSIGGRQRESRGWTS